MERRISEKNTQKRSEAPLPQTFAEEREELARLARDGAGLTDPIFRTHAANAIFLAQKELGNSARIPQSAAVGILLRSEAFDHLLREQPNAEKALAIFGTKIDAIRSFGAAMSEVSLEKEKLGVCRDRPHAPQAETAVEGPVRER